MVDVRTQLATVRAANKQLETALGSGALAKKAVIAQQASDKLWTHPVTGEVYERYPITLNQLSSNITLRDAVAASEITCWEYACPDGVTLQFIPNFAEHYIMGHLRSASGTLNDVDDMPCSLEVWDNFSRIQRGVLWDGTTTEINDSEVYRQNGHPLAYNGDSEVIVTGGDKIKFNVTTPTGGTAIDMTPTGSSTIAFKCYQLTRKIQG